MASVTQSFLKVGAVIGIAFVSYCVATVAYRSTFAPDHGVETYIELKSQGVPMTEGRRVSNPPQHICILGDVDSVMWTLPSGPSA